MVGRMILGGVPERRTAVFSLVAILAVLAAEPVSGKDLVSSSMMVETRDLTSVSPSPDASLVVVGMAHPNPSINEVELTWVITSLRDSRETITVPGGEAIAEPTSPGELLNRRVLWSKDSRWFFYLRMDYGQVQLWKTRRDGKISKKITDSDADLIDLSATADPDIFAVQLAPPRHALERAEKAEYLNGILYDDHVLGGFPLTRTMPMVDRWRSVRRSSNGEWLPPGWTVNTPAAFNVRREQLSILSVPLVDSSPAKVSDNGPIRAEAIPLSALPKRSFEYAGQFTLELKSAVTGESMRRCRLVECIANRVTVLGWSADAAELYYIADSATGRDGPQLPGRATVYAWNPQRDVVRLIHAAGGSLYNLDGPIGIALVPGAIADRDLVVVFAAVDQPPLLESINLSTGARRILFDPNARLRSLTAGRATWKTWKTTRGYAGRGVVVLPDDYHEGKKYPAVLTTYSCGSGFLQGGNGDNASEFVMADHGIIAVCIDVTVRDILAREKDASVIYPVVCDIVTSLIADTAFAAMVDVAHVGLAGHSLGANAGTYCIGHSHAFAAAAFRNGSPVERELWDLFETAAWRRDPVKGLYAKLGMPDPRNDPLGRWAEMSVAQRASDIDTPTLFQVSDTEYLYALPLWGALYEAKKPVEMYVFPEETHRLRQPFHRWLNYERQLDWFEFWLAGKRDDSPSKRDQYGRWNRLRETWVKAAAKE